MYTTTCNCLPSDGCAGWDGGWGGAIFSVMLRDKQTPIKDVPSLNLQDARWHFSLNFIYNSVF